MKKLTRRDFGIGALLGAPGVALAGAKSRMPVTLEADLIVINGTVYTMNEQQPEVGGFAVKNGKIVALGDSDQIQALATRQTQTLDARGMTVLPGFIDAHCHPGEVEELYDINADVRTINEIQAAIRERAAQTPAGFWIRAFKFDDTKLSDKRPLSREDLDAVSGDHPVRVDHRGGHTSWFNSKAFELAGITRQTPDPKDGRYYRTASGELQGEVAENARAVFDTVGRFESFTAEQMRDRAHRAMAHMSKKLTAAGLTSVHDAWVDAQKLKAYQDSAADGSLLHRAYMMPVGMGTDSVYQKLRDAGVYTGLGSDRLQIGAVKFVADGSASERTMRMSTPYAGKPDDFGILTMDQQQIHDAVEAAHRSGWQVGIHANGDVAIDMVLNAYERVQKLWPARDRRHRIEHCSLINPTLIQRIKATGTIPTPFWTYVYYHGEKWAAYGDEKMRSMFAHRSLLEAGIRVPGASDYSPGPFDPMMALQSLVTRTDYAGRVWGANQAISIDQALHVGTINGAYASHEEHIKGSLMVGKHADFVCLNQNPYRIEPSQLKDIAVLRTVVGGQTVYEKV